MASYVILASKLLFLVLIVSNIKFTEAQYDHLYQGNTNGIPLNFLEFIPRIYQKFKALQHNMFNRTIIDFDLLPNIDDILMAIVNEIPIFDENFFAQELSNITTLCQLQSLQFVSALLNGTDWPKQVIDAFGKPSSGILKGSSLWLGEFNQCMNISVPSIGWQGNYCTLQKPSTNPTFSLTFTYGLCVPNTCTVNDVKELIKFGIDKIPSTIKQLIPAQLLDLNSTIVNCHQEKKLDTGAIVSIIILSIIGLVVLLGTIYDVYKLYLINTVGSCMNGTKNIQVTESNGNGYAANNIKTVDQIEHKIEEQEKLVLKILRCFSVYTNTKKLFNTSSGQDHLECLNAIRFLSMAWVILGHSYTFGLNITDNLIDGLLWVKRFSFLIVTNAFFSVDSFFVLSGLLTSYLFMKELNKQNVKLSAGLMVKYYLHRIWRLTPTYMIVLMFSVNLTPYLGDGPVYPKTGFEKPNCKWWTNLLYVNNLVDPTNSCMGVTWYLANDMQFHWIAPMVLIPLALRKRVIGILMSGLLLLASFLSTVFILLANPGTEKGLVTLDASQNFMQKVYIVPWVRIGAFIMGLFCGYLIFLYKTDSLKFRLTERLNLLGWLLSLFLISILVFGLYPDVKTFGADGLSKTAHIFYQCFSRTVWGIALGYLIFACVTSNGGIVNKILSWPIWIPLSRLTYAAYLVHPIIMIYFFSILEHPFHIQELTMIYYYISNLVFSYVAAYFVSVCIEIPFIGLEKYLFRSNSK